MSLSLLWMGTLGMVLALALRRPARRWLGAGPAFAIWLLVPCMMIVALLPTANIAVLPVVSAVTAVPGAWRDGDVGRGMAWLGGVWLTGGLVYALYLVGSTFGSLRRSTPLSAANRQAVHEFLPAGVNFRQARAAGPAVICAWRPIVLLPDDFHARFSAQEQGLALRHELMHVARRDHLWIVFAHALLACCWFNPLAWLALSRCRLDMEIACDAAVLQAMPTARRAYANALVRQAQPRVLALTTAWLAGPHLTERLKMIDSSHVAKPRAWLGIVGLLLVSTGTAFAAKAPDNAAWVSLQTPAPKYPAVAIEHKQSGSVILDIEVSRTGRPGNITVHQASTPEFAKASVDAAKLWRFKPAVRNGKTVAGWVRVPIQFDIDPKAS